MELFSQQRQSDKVKCIACITIALAIVFLGVMVIVGWILNVPALIQVRSSFVPMQFNTALCFLFCGISLVGSVLSRPLYALLPALCVLIISVLTLLEYLVGIDMLIDQLFMEHYIITKTTHPGRMALNTALCFLLSSVTFLLAGRAVHVVVLGAVVMGMGMVSLLGYFLVLDTASLWGEETEMAVHTSSGFLLLGAAILIFGYESVNGNKTLRTHWFTITSTAASLVVVLSVWQALIKQEQKGVHDRVALELHFLQKQLQQNFRSDLAALRHMSFRWALAQQQTDSDRKIDALEYINEFASMFVIAELDESMTESWRVKQRGLSVSKEQLLLNAFSHWRVMDAKVPLSHNPSMSSAFVSDDTSNAFWIKVPVLHSQSIQGFVLGFLDVAKLLSFEGHTYLQLKVFEQGRELIHQPAQGLLDSKHAVVGELNLKGVRLQLELTPTQAYVTSLRSHLPASVLVIGLLTTLGFQYVLYLRRRSVEQGTVLKKLEYQFRTVVENASAAIVMIDRQGDIRMVNALTEKIFGYSRTEMMGEKLELLLPKRLRSAHPAHREHFFVNPSPRGMGVGRELFARRKDGSEFPVEIGLNPLKMDDGHMILASVIDITERKKQQRTLDLHARELERSNKALNDFAYVASHDLKAPLRGIQQLSAWIEDELSAHIQGEVAEYFELLNGRVDRLNTLLDDLLAFSRVGRKHGGFKSLDFEPWVKGIYDMLAPPEGFVLKCHSDFGAFTTLDVPLELILRNLINNAIKHHDKQVGVICVQGQLSEAGYVFSVSDDGPGIEPSQQEKVFEIFQTLRPRDQVEGSGMGLAIVKKSLETYQCKITLASDGLRGSCFTFTWPKEEKLKGMIGAIES